MDIVSDWGPKFTNEFWMQVFKKIESTLSMSPHIILNPMDKHASSIHCSESNKKGNLSSNFGVCLEQIQAYINGI